jgi:hypothetical protein
MKAEQYTVHSIEGCFQLRALYYVLAVRKLVTNITRAEQSIEIC